MIKRTNSREMRHRRHRRIRMNLAGTTARPRVAVFRSSVHIYAQIIDDTTGVTLVQASSLDKDVDSVVPILPKVVAAAAPAPAKQDTASEKTVKGGKPGAEKGGKPAKADAKTETKPEPKAEKKPAAPAAAAKKTRLAQQVGTLLAKRAQEKGSKKVVFDRGGYLYHGRIKALAESARAAGLEF